jgi:hypothetical protein
MKRTLIYFAIAMLAISAAITVAAATTTDSKEVTVKGEIVDLPCYEGKGGARGEGHKACALSCAKKGNQLAIVDEKNNIYSITGAYAENKNEKLIEFVAETVEAKGVVSEKDGKQYIVLSSIKKADKK